MQKIFKNFFLWQKLLHQRVKPTEVGPFPLPLPFLLFSSFLPSLLSSTFLSLPFTSFYSFPSLLPFLLPSFPSSFPFRPVPPFPPPLPPLDFFLHTSLVWIFFQERKISRAPSQTPDTPFLEHFREFCIL
jgi:hypothetical protein